MEDTRRKEGLQDAPESKATAEESIDESELDRDIEDHAPTVPDLKVLDIRSPEPDTTSGFNPYDTVVMHKNTAIKKSPPGKS